MSRNNQYEIKEAIEALLQAYKLKDGNNAQKIISIWKKITGPYIAQHTSVHFENKTLYVSTDNAVLRNELLMNKSQLARDVNNVLADAIVEDIQFKPVTKRKR